MAKQDKRRSKEQDAARPTHTKSNNFNPSGFVISRWGYSTKFHHSKDQVQCSNQNTYIFKNSLKNNITWQREILFPENNILSPSVLQAFVLRLKVLVMAVSKHNFSALDFTVTAVTTWLPNSVASTALPWDSKKKLYSQPLIHALREDPVPSSPRREFLCNPHALPKSHHYEPYFRIRDSIPLPSQPLWRWTLHLQTRPKNSCLLWTSDTTHSLKLTGTSLACSSTPSYSMLPGDTGM